MIRAIEKGHVPVKAELLVGKGADLDVPNVYSDTAWRIAIARGRASGFVMDERGAFVISTQRIFFLTVTIHQTCLQTSAFTTEELSVGAITPKLKNRKLICFEHESSKNIKK